MSVRIARLKTVCRLPGGHEAAGALVDEVVRDQLPRALAASLGPSLERHPAVCRLRALDVVVRIDLETLRRGGLAEAWAGALARSLHEALARPQGDGAWLRVHSSRAEYVAAAAGELLAGRALPTWAVPELAERPDRPSAIAILDLLLGAGPELAETLEALRGAGRLDAALALLDEVGLERLMRALAEAEARPPDLTTGQVAELAAAMAERRTPPRPGDAASRRQAIGLWLELDRALPVRSVWQAGRLLLRVLEQPELIQHRQALADLPAWCGAVLEALAARSPPALAAALERLRPLTPSAAGPDEGRWASSEAAGVFLLLDCVRRLGWVRALRQAGETEQVVHALIAGAAMRLIRPSWSADHGFDPVAAMLAGILGEPDRRALALIYEGPAPALPGLAAADWPALLDAAAEALALSFAARVRGFREAGREAIARHFLRRSGRMLVTADELRVILAPSPWSVALRVSDADAALEGLDWLPVRRVSFVLEGL